MELEFWTEKKVETVMGWRHSTHFARVKDGRFIKPVKITPMLARYPSEEVLQIRRAYLAGKNDDEVRAIVQRLMAARTAPVEPEPQS